MKSYLLTFRKALVRPELSAFYIVGNVAKSLVKLRPTGEIMLFPPKFKR
jgi:hypothetical protein